MGKDHRPRAERLRQRAVGLELQDRIELRIQATVRAAALADPDRRAVLVDADGARGSGAVA
jgi:hypothetical protein